LNTPQTAQLLIALLLPLGDKVAIGVVVLQQPVVELLRDGFFLIVKVVDISRACQRVGVSRCMGVAQQKVRSKETIALTLAGLGG
jgi:hypothetical protein